MPRTYKHGLPFSEKIGENITDLGTRIKNKKASLVIIDGGVGEGKTTLAVHVADFANGKPIKFPLQLAMGGEDFLKKLRMCYEQKAEVIIYDEAGDFNRRGALTRFNAMLNRTFETFRAFQILVILVLPSFHVIDGDLFDKRIPRLLLHCESRSNTSGNVRGYSLYRMMYVRDRMKKMVIPGFAYAKVQPNFYGHFLDLDNKRSRELDVISTSGKLGELQAAETKLSGLVTVREIASKAGKSIPWARKKLKEHKVGALRVIGQKKFYAEDVFKRLAGEGL